MFSFHKPRVYRSSEGCCICRAKSSSSRFTDSKKYEDDSMKCFNLDIPRQGEICNACVLLVKRFKRLPPGSNRHWGHVVDARIGPGMKSMTKFKKLKEESMQQQQHQNILSENSKFQSNGKISSIPEKFCKIFKKNKKKKADNLEHKIHPHREATPGSWDGQSLPATPESIFSDNEEIQFIRKYSSDQTTTSKRRINGRKIKRPIKNCKRKSNIGVFDKKDWERVNVCCGVAFENKKFNALIINCETSIPCSDHVKYLVKRTEPKILNTDIQSMKTSIISREKKEQKHIPKQQALKKHQLFFKRQLENIPKTENYYKTDSNCNPPEFLDDMKSKHLERLNNGTNTDRITAHLELFNNDTIENRITGHLELLGKKPNAKNISSLLHKMKSETEKAMKNSVDKINMIRLKPKDMANAKTSLRNIENSMNNIPIDKTSITQKCINPKVDASTTKFSDNSSDSGFEENLQDPKQQINVESQDKKKKIILRPGQTMYLAPTAGLQVQTTQPNPVLPAILQSTKQQKAQKITQNAGCQTECSMCIINPTTEGAGIMNIMSSGKLTNNSTKKNISPSNLNQKIVYLKAKYNKTKLQLPN